MSDVVHSDGIPPIPADAVAVVVVGDGPLTPADVAAVARDRARMELSAEGAETMRRARGIVDDHVRLGAPIYGLTTGLGANADIMITAEELLGFQESVPRSHSVGMGPPLPTVSVRAMMAARVASMSAGGSGASEQALRALIDALNVGIHPIVPSWGSIGAADLAPLAHVARALTGEGLVEFRGETLDAGEALSRAGLRPVSISGRDGHALVGANSLSVGTASLVLEELNCQFGWLLSAVALSYEGFRANLSSIDAEALAARPAFGQEAVASRLRQLMTGSGLWKPNAARRLQDPLSYRCVPQVAGALWHAMEEAMLATSIELASSGDNPVVLLDSGRIVAQGNFDLTAFALSWEGLGLAMAQCATGSAHRTMRLLSSQFSGLPRSLASGTARAGYAVLQKSISALEAEIRHFANPLSLNVLAVADGIEDHASMAPRVVHKTAEIVARLRYLIAIELIVGATAVEVRGVTDELGSGAAAAYGVVRSMVSPLDVDRELASELEALARHLANTSL